MALLNHLNTLEAHGLIRLSAAQPELEYLFRHALVQDAAYQSLLKPDRQQMHLAVGEALERRDPESADEMAAMLGYHFERARRPEKAAYYLKRAAEHARDIYANAEAIAFYQRAISLAEQLIGEAGDRLDDWRMTAVELSEAASDLLELTGQHDGAIAGYDHAVSLGGTDDPIRVARLRRKTAYVCLMQRQHDQALAIFAEAEAILGQNPETSPNEWWEEWIQIQLDQMFLRYLRSEVLELMDLLERTRPVIETFGKPEQRFGFFRSLVLQALRRERYFQVSDETLANARSGIAPAQASNNLNAAAEAFFTIGFCHATRWEKKEAEENMLASLRLAERAGNVAIVSRSLTHLTNLYRRYGQVADVRDFNARALKAAEAGQLLEYAAAAKANEAWLAWREGDLTLARQLGEDGLQMWRKMPVLYPFQWTTLFPLLGIALANNQPAEAVEYARMLISPGQQRLPDALAEALAAAIESAEHEGDDAMELFNNAARLASEAGFL